MIQVYAVNASNINQEVYDTLYAQAPQERKIRADRCLSREDAVCCIAAERLLRYAVKTHLGNQEFALETNAYGKPRIKGNPDFHFNLSHSGNWVVLACGNSEVGIDVENLRMDDKKQRLARRFFTPKEQDYVFQEEFEKRFFEVWTAKESYLKYLGTGLQKSLSSFCVRSMDAPRFFSQWLGDSCVTLCTQEENYLIEQIPPEVLL